MLKFLETVNQYLGNPYDNGVLLENYIQELTKLSKEYDSIVKLAFENSPEVKEYSTPVSLCLQKKSVLDLQIEILRKIKRRV